MNLSPQNSTAAARLTAAGIGAAGSFILFAAYMVVPPAGLFSGLLAPFPAIFTRFRYGRMVAVTITLGTAALLAAVFGVQAAGLYLIQCAVIAHLVPELLIGGKGTARTMLWTTAANLVVYAVAIAALMLITGKDVHGLAVREISASMNQAAAIYEKSGVKGEDLAALKQSMKMAADLIIRIYPALMTVILVVMTGVNIALLRRTGERLGIETGLGRFNDFRVPEPLIWLLIGAGFSMLITDPVITTPALNVIVVLLVFYFLQGLAVCQTVINRLLYPGFMRLVMYLMLIFQPYIAALVAAVGIFDLWGNFRAPRKQENL